MALIIGKQSLEYLVNARGDLYHLRHDKDAWHHAYFDELQRTIYQLQKQPVHVLDIGSGLGAIDVCLSKFYDANCTMIDGEVGNGKVTKHAKPFCSREAVDLFWQENGITPQFYTYRNPDQLDSVSSIFDTVLSLRSWCFHYPPETYLGFVQRNTCAGSHILVDVRRKEREWRTTMRTAFRELHVFQSEIKFDRVLFEVRGAMQ